MWGNQNTIRTPASVPVINCDLLLLLTARQILQVGCGGWRYGRREEMTSAPSEAPRAACLKSPLKLRSLS